MRRYLSARVAGPIAGMAFGLAAVVCPAGDARAAPAHVVLLTIDGAIGPATQEYVHRGLATAAESHAEAAILQMDTPGGLDVSMRGIIQDILASPVPVIGYVAPAGARAASAGTYLLYAAHVAAMAPATNVGAATPVAIGIAEPPKPEAGTAKPDVAGNGGDENTMTRKQVHDAAAYIRGLAQLRHRNADWAERAVRESVSLSADEALKQGVIDLIATDRDDLLARIDGRIVQTPAGTRPLATRAAAIDVVEPNWRTRLLAVITNPSVALLLMLGGTFGLAMELMSPGAVLPGVAGGLCLLLALFALQMIPVHIAGVLLIVLGVGFIGGEIALPAYGSLGVGGAIAIAVGALILVEPGNPGFEVPLGIAIGSGVIGAALAVFVGRMAWRARRRPITSGPEMIVGSAGEVVEWTGDRGWIRLDGELWRARWMAAAPAPSAVRAGDTLRVVALEGLTLRVTGDGNDRRETGG